MSNFFKFCHEIRVAGQKSLTLNFTRTKDFLFKFTKLFSTVLTKNWITKQNIKYHRVEFLLEHFYRIIVTPTLMETICFNFIERQRPKYQTKMRDETWQLAHLSWREITLMTIVWSGYFKLAHRYKKITLWFSDLLVDRDKIRFFSLVPFRLCNSWLSNYKTLPSTFLELSRGQTLLCF